MVERRKGLREKRVSSIEKVKLWNNRGNRQLLGFDKVFHSGPALATTALAATSILLFGSVTTATARKFWIINLKGTSLWGNKML